MPLVTVKKADGTCRDLEIMFVRLSSNEDDAQIVQRMFDVTGSETTDPIEAVEVEIDGGLLDLQEGDRLTVRVDVN